MDMASRVKECAEKVMDTLGRQKQLNVLSVAEQVGERNVIAYQAIGWLAHAGKIRYVQNGNQVYLTGAGDQV